MNKLNIAYIGMGLAVTKYHLPFVLGRKEFEVKYIYRREEDRKLDLGIEEQFPDIPVTTDFEEIAKNPEINLVVVASPQNTHESYAKKLLSARKNVLMEKPFAASSEAAEEIFNEAKQKNLIIMPNQNRRYDGDFLTLKKVLNRGVLGEIIELESHYDYFRPTVKPDSFGLLFGLGVHTIDQMVSLSGVPERIVYDVRGMHHPGKSDDYFDIDLFYGRTKVTVKTTYFAKISSPRFIVHGTKGSFVLPAVGHNSEGNTKSEAIFGDLSYIDGEGKECNEKVPLEETSYISIYEDLLQSIFEGKEKAVKDDEVIEVLRILEGGVVAGREP